MRRRTPVGTSQTAAAGHHGHKGKMDVDRGLEFDIAVVGSGISGLACAWLLSQRHRVTLYEAAPRLGGHTNTVEVAGPRGAQPVDTGFIVYNEATYPNLIALFAHLGVETQVSDMSFAVSLDDGRLEYAGTDLNGLFAQRSNLLRPRFLFMLRDLLRFYREAPGKLAGLETLSLGAFLDRDGYGRAFRDDHLLPMAAAIWSAPSRTLLEFPAASFVRFCDNHGLLKVSGRPLWRTVTGGSRRYVDKLTASFADRIHLGRGILSIERDGTGVILRDRAGTLPVRHDHAVIATHADEALAMLDKPSVAERDVLGAIGYSSNRAVLHSDKRLMPRRRKVWSSWNYFGRRGGDTDALCVTYWMQKLQNLPADPNYFVTLNPVGEPSDIHYETTYAHPVFDLAALDAQKRLWSLQGNGSIWYCGAYFGAGFHEDGLQAGLAVAEALGGTRRPWNVAGESDRIYLDETTMARPATQVAA